MQGDSGKCCLILKADKPVVMQVGQSLIKSTSCEKFVVVKIDANFTFDKHKQIVCKKESNKLTSSLKISDLTKNKLFSLILTQNDEKTDEKRFSAYFGSFQDSLIC